MQWAPLGTQDAPFRGALDGSGHRIDNLCIDAPGADRQGLIGCADGAAARDLSVSGSVVGRNYVGAIMAVAENGATIEGCSADADVSGSDYVGGLLGEAAGGEVTVRRSSHAGAVSGSGEVGGLACSAWAAGTVLAIEDCFHRGDVSSSGADGKACAGGLLGRGANGFNGASVAIRDSYAAGAVSCSNGAYGVARPRSDSGGTVAMENCYYDSELAPGLGAQEGEAALPTADLQSWRAAYLLNGRAFAGGMDGSGPDSTTWTVDSAANPANGGYPVFGDLRAAELRASFDPAAAAGYEGGRLTAGLTAGGAPA